MNRRHSVPGVTFGLSAYSRAARSFALAGGALLASAAAACSASPSSESSPSAAPDFAGPYVTIGPGDIAAMEFHDHGYTLTPTGCTTQSCVDVGTYSISSDGGTLTLESSITGAERAIAIAIVETRAADASGAGLLGPRAEPVVKPGQTLTNPGTKIISAEEIVRALLPKQRQQLVTDPAPRSVPPDR